MCLMHIIQFSVADSVSKDQLTFHFRISVLFCFLLCLFVCLFPETVWEEHWACKLWIHWKIVHCFSKDRATIYSPMKQTQWDQTPGGGQHLWRGLSECAGQWKNNCKYLIWGVLYHLYTVYWHFIDSVCSTNVMSHRMKWGVAPEKPCNLAGSGTELLGNPQEKSQPEL